MTVNLSPQPPSATTAIWLAKSRALVTNPEHPESLPEIAFRIAAEKVMLIAISFLAHAEAVFRLARVLSLNLASFYISVEISFITQEKEKSSEAYKVSMLSIWALFSKGAWKTASRSQMGSSAPARVSPPPTLTHLPLAMPATTPASPVARRAVGIQCNLLEEAPSSLVSPGLSSDSEEGGVGFNDRSFLSAVLDNHRSRERISSVSSDGASTTSYSDCPASESESWSEVEVASEDERANVAETELRNDTPSPRTMATYVHVPSPTPVTDTAVRSEPTGEETDGSSWEELSENERALAEIRSLPEDEPGEIGVETPVSLPVTNTDRSNGVDLARQTPPSPQLVPTRIVSASPTAAHDDQQGSASETEAGYEQVHFSDAEERRNETPSRGTLATYEDVPSQTKGEETDGSDWERLSEEIRSLPDEELSEAGVKAAVSLPVTNADPSNTADLAPQTPPHPQVVRTRIVSASPQAAHYDHEGSASETEAGYEQLNLDEVSSQSSGPRSDFEEISDLRDDAWDAVEFRPQTPPTQPISPPGIGLRRRKPEAPPTEPNQTRPAATQKGSWWSSPIARLFGLEG